MSAVSGPAGREMKRLARVLDAPGSQYQPWVPFLLGGQLAFAALSPTMPWPANLLDHETRPAIVLLGDDPPVSEATGPDGWDCAGPKMVRWARFVIIHGAAADVAQYRSALSFVAAARRLLFIETASNRINDWLALFPGTPATAFAPPEGVQHPISQVRALQ